MPPQRSWSDLVDETAQRRHVQVLIVGGGINGIATFRDLALQGVNVALVERDDFCSGASAASSHMIHGGIRYLENGEFRLVKESVQERNRLVRIAPHHVAPLLTTIPIRSTFSGILAAPLRFLRHGSSKSRERGAVLIKAGLMIYDAFSRGGGQVPRHRFVGREKARRELPQLHPRFRYTASYFDASVASPERLAIDLLHDGLAAGPHATAVNHVEAVGMDESGVRLRAAGSLEEFTLRADVVINASGAWTDLTNQALGNPTAYMGGTKGSHVVLDHPELQAACAGREIFFENSDGRIVLIYPLGDRVIVGTSDIPADPAAPAIITDDEIDYFFALVGEVFPDIELRRDQIVHTFSGIRPLPRTDDLQPGFISRDYRIERADVAGHPVLSLVGGKLTTFRALAEHLAGDALAVIGGTRTADTRELPIGGAAGLPRTSAERLRWLDTHRGDVVLERAEELLERYGTRAAEVLAAIDPASDRGLTTAPRYSVHELRYLAATEQVVHLADLVLRRTDLAMAGDAGPRALAEAADAIAETLGWDDARVADEIARTTRLLDERHPAPGRERAQIDA